ncbi:hypothetical protein Tco_0853732 [Tanacetum coccineum]
MEVPHQNGHSGARRLLFEKELTPSDVASNIGALGMGTQGTYVESKKDEEDQKMQTTKGFTLFGVHIIP